jgi:hypothetical protein
MEEREYGPRRGYYDRDFERFERGGHEPLLSRTERERLRGRIASRLEREPLFTPYERERLRERYAYRHPMYGHRYEQRPYAYRYGYERPYGYRYGYERPYGYRYGYERRHERPYGYRYGHEYGPEYYGRR